MNPAHLNPTVGSNASPSSPGNLDPALSPVLRRLVEALVPLPTHRAIVTAALEDLGLQHEDLITTVLQFSTPQDVLSGAWEVMRQRKVPEAQKITFMALFNALFAKLRAPTPSADSSTKKRQHPDSSSASPRGGRRLSPDHLLQLDTANDKFWLYLAVAASLTVEERDKKYICACEQKKGEGEEETTKRAKKKKGHSAEQGFNFVTHAMSCGGMLRSKPTDEGRARPRNPTTNELQALYELSSEAFRNIPQCWRTLIPSPPMSTPTPTPTPMPTPTPTPTPPPAVPLAPPVVDSDAHELLVDGAAAATSDSVANFFVDPHLVNKT